MQVTLEEQRLVITPGDDDEANMLARWHREFQVGERAEVFFRHRNQETAGLDLVLRS
jgi:hypothetical protein